MMRTIRWLNIAHESALSDSEASPELKRRQNAILPDAVYRRISNVAYVFNIWNHMKKLFLIVLLASVAAGAHDRNLEN